ncbi:MAG TPA: Na(+)/H(+) antiporter subunit D [Desulfobulbaceae bacterium]|nr:Na(+)/H(+) antiporter subunit D [Desulfobulbaceae bacterium]
MTDIVHPSLILLGGALLLPFIRGPLRKPYLLLVPLLTLFEVVSLSGQNVIFGVYQFMDWQLVFGRIDRLSTIFALIMSLVGVIGTLYGLHVDRAGEHMAAWSYLAGALGVIYCADYLSLFLFWELMAFASVFLIWFRRTKKSLSAGYRYILVHAVGGVILLAGIMLRYQAVGTISFGLLDVHHPQLYTWLILTGFCLNAAVVPLHAWLPDAYSHASFNGAVFLCAVTTKTAIYTLARAFPGMNVLVILGVVMALWGMIYTIMENDIRKLLAWSIVSQVGYMVTGVGIGTELAINGAAAHAVAHILYKSLLFMGTGSVLYMTGTTKLTGLGGLYKKMPATLIFTIIGCQSISAAPFFAAYVSKPMIITAGYEAHLVWASWLLMFGATGTFIYNGLKLPYFLFFSENKCSDQTWERAADPPWNMMFAMLIGSTLCMVVGSFPTLLYRLLPYPVDFNPYTMYQFLETSQLLGLAAVAFFLLKKYTVPEAKITLSMDWFYRMGGRVFMWLVRHPIQWIDSAWGEAYRVVGLRSLMATAGFWSWFDRAAIDGVVDGFARLVRGLGGRLRLLQSGQVQVSIYFAAALSACLLLAYVLSRLY